MTIVTDPYTQLADILETVVTEEFADEPYLVCRHDRIHESLGNDGRTYVGISPDSEPSRDIELFVEVLIQFYGPWKEAVDPAQGADPRIMTNKAERLRRALSVERTVGLPGMWFFDVVNTRYPNDPTGNKTRFEMSITGRGNNTGLIETIG